LITTNNTANNAIKPMLLPTSTMGLNVGNAPAGIEGMSGGLAFIEAPMPQSNNGNATNNISNSFPSGGISPSGFMKVFVVGGGINLSKITYTSSQINRTKASISQPSETIKKA
jgi:hypothetical protein